MNITSLFESWRATHKTGEGWGLAWYLAYEFCVRFYASHGIYPAVLEHDGAGYYGLTLQRVRCRTTSRTGDPLGRLTMSGDVENWTTGGPGNHRLNTTDMCDSGLALDRIVTAAISHMALPMSSAESHRNCRHRQWGKAYELMFSVATILALREACRIWNHPMHVDRLVQELDPLAKRSEHLGAFLFEREEKKVVVAADGRLLGGAKVNYWERFMRGESAFAFASEIEQLLNE